MILIKRLKEQEILIFDSYKDALDWIKIKSNEYGSKNAFLSSDEYRSVYPYLDNLYQNEKELYRKTAEDAMADVGIQFGDRVYYDYLGSFFDVDTYTGIVINKNGIPYVKYDKGLVDMAGRKSSKWHKGWKKL